MSDVTNDSRGKIHIIITCYSLGTTKQNFKVSKLRTFSFHWKLATNSSSDIIYPNPGTTYLSISNQNYIYHCNMSYPVRELTVALFSFLFIYFLFCFFYYCYDYFSICLCLFINDTDLNQCLVCFRLYTSSSLSLLSKTLK